MNVVNVVKLQWQYENSIKRQNYIIFTNNLFLGLQVGLQIMFETKQANTFVEIILANC